MADNGSLSNLNRNQRKALDALLKSTTVAEAAQLADLGERTLYRYLTDPDFDAALRNRQTRVVSETVAALIGGSGEALDVLKDVMNDPEASPSVRTRAALGWLREQWKAVELSVVLARLEALERDVKQRLEQRGML
jgi:hypothetical protein